MQKDKCDRAPIAIEKEPFFSFARFSFLSVFGFLLASEVCARGRLCKPPDHWSRNLFQDPPSDAEFPAEIAEKFDDGQPWYNAADELSCFALWRALDEDM